MDADPAGAFFTGAGLPSLLFCFEDAVPFEYKRLKTGVSPLCVVLVVVLGRVGRVFGPLTAWAPAVRAAALSGFLLLEDKVCVLYKRSNTEPALALGAGTLATRLVAAVFDVRDDSTAMVTNLKYRFIVGLGNKLFLFGFVVIVKNGGMPAGSRARKLGNGRH